MVDSESVAGAAEERREFPPLVYVPTTGEDDPEIRRIVMHKVEDGRTALYTYSAIDRLRRYYLPEAPWVVCDVPALQRVYDETPYDLLFLDVDPGLRDEEEDGTS